MLSSCKTEKIVIAARPSPLSRVQVDEVLEELRLSYSGKFPEFETVWVHTIGDRDKKTSLRTMAKSNFFTKEIDQLLLKKSCRVAIHSAKDLPEPIENGLALIALTRRVDSSDSLVLCEGESLQSLPKGACIATSSLRREEIVRQMRPDLTFVDLRGTIGERLEKLQHGEIDGLVIAEAALIRLKLTHLNRLRLPGETTPLQGQLAVIAREEDQEMANLFSCIDARNHRRELGSSFTTQ
jgi:hydroxymethylbilane synthase